MFFYNRLIHSEIRWLKFTRFLKNSESFSKDFRFHCTKYNVTEVNDDLKEIFRLKDTNISSWIVENKVQTLCNKYNDFSTEDRAKFLRVLAKTYSVDHDDIRCIANDLVSKQVNNQRQLLTRENNLKNSLTPLYHWLFVIMGRLEYGVKFLVDLRTHVLELLSATTDDVDDAALLQLNLTIKELLFLWFSIGFLHLERVTWQSSCEMLEKISDYEAIHPIRNWVDLKRRVGPYRRCFVFTHLSMPKEPIVVLHTALCDIIPETRKGIEEAEERMLGVGTKLTSFVQEDKSKIKAAIFYSISSTQKGLQGIELGNYLIKKVAKQVISEFPRIDQLASLSPIPGFKSWFLEQIKQDPNQVMTKEERERIEGVLESQDLFLDLKKTFANNLWINDKTITDVLKVPLMRSCAWYLFKGKRRNYALNAVANFHLKNGAMMWRINWMADTSPRGAAASCGLMVNYRYFLDKTENNSRNYIENYYIPASEGVSELAAEAETLRKIK